VTRLLASDSADARKARGAFFTPPPLCRYVADWAIRSPADDALAHITGAPRGHLDGVELHADSARQAEAFVRAAGHEARVTVGDFFLVPPAPTYDAVTGNPPYVRYQDFTGEARMRSRQAALRAGVSPWWRVPLVAPADLLLTYMNADTPRLCANRKHTHHLNSVHGVYLRPELRELGMDLLPLGALTSMTLLGAETVGRAYGGGMLKLEPKEADRLPVPTPEVLHAARGALVAIRPQVAARLRRPKGLTEAVKLVDDVLLLGELGLPRSQVKSLREAHAELTARRVARGGAGRGQG